MIIYTTNVASRVPPEANAGRSVNGITDHNGKWETKKIWSHLSVKAEEVHKRTAVSCECCEDNAINKLIL